MKLLLTLGPGLDPAPHGDLVVLDWPSRKIVDRFRYTNRVYEQSHKGLAGASWTGHRLLVATEAELLELDVAPLRLVESRTFRCLNDVHHLAASGGRIWVCNTGLDCIEELDSAWRPVKTHHLTARFGRRLSHVLALLRDDLRKSWRRMRGHYDFYTHLTKRPRFRNIIKLLYQNAYRRNGMDVRYCDFRPHVLHPNHVLPLGDDVWITLWRTGEIVSLRNGTILAGDLGHPHDGYATDEQLYVTDCKSNRLIVHRLHRNDGIVGKRLAERTVTRKLTEGFLRGVAVVGDYVFLGLTARRGAPLEFQSARVIALDRRSLEPVDEWAVPKEYGLHVFSIVDVSQAYS